MGPGLIAIVSVASFLFYMGMATATALGLYNKWEELADWRNKYNPRTYSYHPEPDSFSISIAAFFWPFAMWWWLGMATQLRRLRRLQVLREAEAERERLLESVRKELEGL